MGRWFGFGEAWGLREWEFGREVFWPILKVWLFGHCIRPLSTCVWHIRFVSHCQMVYMSDTVNNSYSTDRQNCRNTKQENPIEITYILPSQC